MLSMAPTAIVLTRSGDPTRFVLMARRWRGRHCTATWSPHPRVSWAMNPSHRRETSLRPVAPRPLSLIPAGLSSPTRSPTAGTCSGPRMAAPWTGPTTCLFSRPDSSILAPAASSRAASTHRLPPRPSRRQPHLSKRSIRRVVRKRYAGWSSTPRAGRTPCTLTSLRGRILRKESFRFCGAVTAWAYRISNAPFAVLQML